MGVATEDSMAGDGEEEAAVEMSFICMSVMFLNLLRNHGSIRVKS